MGKSSSKLAKTKEQRDELVKKYTQKAIKWEETGKLTKYGEKYEDLQVCQTALHLLPHVVYFEESLKRLRESGALDNSKGAISSTQSNKHETTYSAKDFDDLFVQDMVDFIGCGDKCAKKFEDIQTTMLARDKTRFTARVHKRQESIIRLNWDKGGTSFICSFMFMARRTKNGELEVFTCYCTKEWTMGKQFSLQHANDAGDIWSEDTNGVIQSYLDYQVLKEVWKHHVRDYNNRDLEKYLLNKMNYGHKSEFQKLIAPATNSMMIKQKLKQAPRMVKDQNGNEVKIEEGSACTIL